MTGFIGTKVLRSGPSFLALTAAIAYCSPAMAQESAANQPDAPKQPSSTHAAAQANAEPAAGAPASPDRAAAAGTEQAGEIVVMARRRAESAIDAPLAVTALSDEKLREQSIVNFTDLSRVAPNVVLRQTNSGGGTVDAMIRGQSIPLANIAIDPSVGFYFDDVIVAQGKGAAAGIFDVQSVEVARGVQGTLRGRNNTGGAISIYTHRPNLHDLTAEFSGTYGSRNYLQTQAILNAPISDVLGIRLGFQRITQDGYGHSIVTGQELGGRNQWIGRGSVLFEPNSNLSFLMTYEHTKIDQPPIGRRSLPGTAVYNALITGTQNGLNTSGLHLTPDQIIPPDFWDASTSYVMGNDRANVDFLRATLSYRFSDLATFKLIAGYRDLFSLGGIDLDGGPALNLETEQGGTSKQLTVEPQLFGKLGRGLSYILGYYYFKDRGKLIADTTPYAINAANPTNPFRNHIVIREGGKNISNAVYGHLEFKVTDRLELAGGARYTWDKRSVFPDRVLLHSDPRSSTFSLFQAGIVKNVGCLFTTNVGGVQRPAGGFVVLGNGAVVASGACPDVELKSKFSYFSYELSARYEFSRNLAAYVRHGLGQKSGGINIPVSSIDSPVRFDPEKVRDYEIGLKASRLFDGLLDFNLALFYSDYKDLQRNIGIILGGTTATLTVNAGSAHVKGIEADFVFRATDRLTFSGFAGYTDAKYKRFFTIGPTGPVDLSNQPFPQTPKFTSRLAVAYELPVGPGNLRLNAGWNHQSNASYQAIFFPGAESGVLNLVDARISWTSDNNRWELAAYGTNLLNEKYFTSAQANRAGVDPSPSAVQAALGTQGEPRFFGVSATMRLGR
jgi:iron complex outermembrane receptor protein